MSSTSIGHSGIGRSRIYDFLINQIPTIILTTLFVFPVWGIHSDTASAEGTWTVYNESVLEGWATTVADDPEGGVWAGRRGAILYFNGIGWTFHENEYLLLSQIDDMVVDREGVVFFGRPNFVYGYDGSSWRTVLEIEGMRPYGMVVDHDNIFWFSAGDKGLFSYDGESVVTYESPFPYGVQVRAVTADNALWCSHNGGNLEGNGVSLFRNGEWIHFSTADGIAGEYVSDIEVDHDGIVWCGTLNGISSYDGETWTTFTKSDGLIGNEISAVAVDRNNVKWFGAKNGITEYDGSSWTKYYQLLAPRKIVVDAQNRKWFETSGAELTCYDDHEYPFVWITNPKGAELLLQESNFTVTWQSYGVETVDIAISTDDGANWSTVGESIDAAPGSYTFQLPVLNSKSCHVRIRGHENPLVSGINNHPFTISPRFVEVTTPNGGESWNIDTSHRITWTALDVETVDIDYSTDGGETWSPVEHGVAASRGFASWTTPDEPSPSCLVRITETGDTGTSDVSDASFIIPENTIEVLWPSGNVSLPGETFTTVNWSASPGLKNVRIDFSTDGGSNWTTVASGVTASHGEYVWKTPDMASSSCLIRITVEDYPGLSATSPGMFTITQPRTWDESWTTIYTMTGKTNRLAVSNDYIWCGTEGGVVRVNADTGSQTVYRINQGLPDNRIRDIAVMSGGGVWAGTPAGVSRFENGQWTTWTTDNGLLENDVTALAVDGDDTLWIGANGYHYQDRDGWQTVVIQSFDGVWQTRASGDYRMEDRHHTAFLYNPARNSLWVSNSSGTTEHELPSLSRLNAIEGNAVDLAADSDGKVWEVVGDGSVILFDGEKSTGFSPEGKGFSGRALSVAAGSDGTAWIGTEAGLVHFDGSVLATLTSADGLINDTVNALAFDGAGTLWIGTDGGLSGFDGESFTNVPFDNSMPQYDRIWESAVDRDNVKWFGTMNGVVRYDGKEFTSFNTDDGLAHWEVYRVAVGRNNDKWFGCGEGISRFDGETWTTFDEDPRLKALYQALTFDHYGNLWAISYEGDLSRYDGTSWTFFKQCPRKSHEDIAFDRSGTLWSASGKNVYSFDGETWTEHNVGGVHCSSILVDHDGVIWMSTSGGQIFSYNSGAWNIVRTVPGEISGNEITDIAEDNGGILWFSTNAGLASYDRSRWNVYTSSNSKLVSDRVRTVAVDNDNVLWIGAEGGITSFYSELETGIEDPVVQPRQFSIRGNFPNPFNASTTIEFTLSETSPVTVTVYNVLGQRIRILDRSVFTAGRHTVRWDGTDDYGMSVSSGVYLVHMKTRNISKSHRMLLLK